MSENDFNHIYIHNRDVFFSRDSGLFHANLAFHILDYFGLDDIPFFISELFDDFYKMVSAKRNAKNGVQFYFGGVKQLRSSIFYQAFAIDREKMTAAGIAIKYGCSYREVHRGLKAVGCVQPGGFGRRVKFRGYYES